MIARYNVVSRQTRYENPKERGKPAKARRKRVDELALELEAFKMPTCKATRSTALGPAEAILTDIERHQNSLRSLIVHREDGPLVEAEYLTATCPHCGAKEELEHDRWRVFESGHLHIGQVTSEHYLDDEEEAPMQFADFPDDWMPFREGSLASLAGYRETVEMPYGSQLPIDGFKIGIRQPTLPFPEFESRGSQEAYGRIGGYKGVYSCQHCNGAYYVMYNKPGWDKHVICPEDLKAYESLAPIKSLEEIVAVVESDEYSISIRFSPALEGRVGSIRFDLARGYTEVDGRQLMKGDDATDASLGLLPTGFACDELFSLLAMLMEERIGDVKRSLELIGTARRATIHGSMLGPGPNIVDFAIANRLRGYPDALYERVFVQSRWHPDSYTPCMAPFGVLPVSYKGVDDAYNLSGLPQVKSIRRIAFGQPLFISYAHAIRSIPFDDPNILKDLLSNDSALRLFEAIRRSRGEVTIFEYLRETRGELTTWTYIKALMSGSAPLYFLGFGGKRKALGNGVKQMVDRLPIGKAGEVLQGVLSECEDCGRDLLEEYGYTMNERHLEGAAGGFDFKLPPSPLDVIVVGADMGNCLSGYVDRIGGNRAVIIAYRNGRAEGAIDVRMEDLRVTEARARCNKALSSNRALNEAFYSWIQEKRLGYEPARRGE